MFRTADDKVLTEFARDSRELYSALEGERYATTVRKEPLYDPERVLS